MADTHLIQMRGIPGGNGPTVVAAGCGGVVVAGLGLSAEALAKVDEPGAVEWMIRQHAGIESRVETR